MVRADMQAQARRRALLAEVADEAANGAVERWAQVVDYVWWSPEHAGGTADPGPDGTHNARITLRPTASADRDRVLAGDPQGHVMVNLPSLNRALTLLGPQTADARFRLAQVEAGHQQTVGSAAADVLVQLAVFGRVVHVRSRTE